MRNDGTIHLVEVKSAWQSNDPVVLAKKDAAEQLAEGNRFHYAMITKDNFEAFLDKRTGWQNYVGQAGMAALAL